MSQPRQPNTPPRRTPPSTVRTSVRKSTLRQHSAPVPAVFLDRDGTLMEDVGYCSQPSDVRVFNGVPHALEALRNAGFLLILVTNQSGIGRGYFTEDAFREVQAEFERQIDPARLDATYYCPDDPGVDTARRKPAPTMVFEAMRDLRIDATRSFFVGDKEIDCLCGKRAGVRTILVRTGQGAEAGGPIAADRIVRDFTEAADYILSRHGRA